MGGETWLVPPLPPVWPVPRGLVSRAWCPGGEVIPAFVAAHLEAIYNCGGGGGEKKYPNTAGTSPPTLEIRAKSHERSWPGAEAHGIVMGGGGGGQRPAKGLSLKATGHKWSGGWGTGSAQHPPAQPFLLLRPLATSCLPPWFRGRIQASGLSAPPPVLTQSPPPCSDTQGPPFAHRRGVGERAQVSGKALSPLTGNAGVHPRPAETRQGRGSGNFIAPPTQSAPFGLQPALELEPLLLLCRLLLLLLPALLGLGQLRGQRDHAPLQGGGE